MSTTLYTIKLYLEERHTQHLRSFFQEQKAILLQQNSCTSSTLTQSLTTPTCYHFCTHWTNETERQAYAQSESLLQGLNKLNTLLLQPTTTELEKNIEPDRTPEQQAFAKLVDIMDLLREQCPWDKKQTLESIRNLTIEETYELADAITNKDLPELKKELGDLLLHIVFYAKIAKEMQAFTLLEVIDTICEKLIYRHPHIFSDTQVDSAKEVEANWEKLKLKEKGRKKALLSGVPSSLPALIKAYRIQDKARGVGFDWDEPMQVWDKVKEEIQELEEELKVNNQKNIESEIGDVLFSIINAARLFDVDPENALEQTNRKFIYRFNYLEEKTMKQGLSLKDMTLEEMEAIWQEAKRKANDAGKEKA